MSNNKGEKKDIHWTLFKEYCMDNIYKQRKNLRETRKKKTKQSYMKPIMLGLEKGSYL